MNRFLVILMGLLMVIGGVYCLFTPVTTFLATGYVVGVIIFCDAIGNIVAWVNAKTYVEVSGWYLANAIISLIFGIVVIVSLRMQIAVDMFIVYAIAIWVIILGISRISLAIRMKKLIEKLPKVFKNNKWGYVLALGILMVIFGLLCMIRPVVLSSMLGVFIALIMIFAGASLITLGSYVYVE